jgi:hypothetical protein
MRGRVRIYDTWQGDESDNWDASYRENGKNLIVIFEGFNQNPPLCTLESDTVTPMTGNNVRFSSEVILPYG